MTTNLTDLFEQIDELIGLCGPAANRHDKAAAAISACIANGIDTEGAIIRVLSKYGFKGGHIAKMLDNREGPFRNSDHWLVGADGRYSLVDAG